MLDIERRLSTLFSCVSSEPRASIHKATSSSPAAIACWLKIEHERLKWMMSDMYSREREQGSTQLGYAYGDYTPKDKT